MNTLKKTWDRRLTLAKKKSVFCEKDREMAKHWPTCAVGEGMVRLASEKSRRDFIHDRANFFTRYAGLYALGFEFHHMVSADRPYEAEAMRTRIERYIERFLSEKKKVSP